MQKDTVINNSREMIEQAVASLGAFIPHQVMATRRDDLIQIFQEALNSKSPVRGKCTGELSTYSSKIDLEAQKFSLIACFELAADTPSLSRAAERYYYKEIGCDTLIIPTEENKESKLAIFERNMKGGIESTIAEQGRLIFPDNEKERENFAEMVKALLLGGCNLSRYNLQNFFTKIGTLKTPSIEGLSDLRATITWAVDLYFDLKFDTAENTSSLSLAAMQSLKKIIAEDQFYPPDRDTRVAISPYLSTQVETEIKELIKKVFPDDKVSENKLQGIVFKTLLRAANFGLVLPEFTLGNFCNELNRNPIFRNLTDVKLIPLKNLLLTLPDKIKDIKENRAKLLPESDREWIKKLVLYKKIDESAAPCKKRSEFLKYTCLGYFARIGDIRYDDAASSGRPVTPLQGKHFSYFRDYKKSNVFLSAAHRNIQRLLNRRRRNLLQPSDFYITSDEAMKKSQKVRYHYVDIDKLPNSVALERQIEGYLDRFSKEGHKIPHLYLGFKTKGDDEDDEVLAAIGAKLEVDVENYRSIINRCVENCITKWNLTSNRQVEAREVIYPKIILAATTKAKGMPVIHAPRLAPLDVQISEEDRVQSFVQSEIIYSGKTPTVQKVASFLSKVMGFTEIWYATYSTNLADIEKGILEEINSEESAKTAPKTLTDLVRDPIFVSFEKYTSQVGKQFPGLELACSAVIRVIKGLRDLEEQKKLNWESPIKEFHLPSDFFLKSFGKILQSMQKQMEPKKTHEHHVDEVFEEILIWLNMNQLYKQEDTEKLFVHAQFRSTGHQPDFVQMTRGGQHALDAYFKVMLKAKGSAVDWEKRRFINQSSLYYEARFLGGKSVKMVDQRKTVGLEYPFKENLLHVLERKNSKIRRYEAAKNIKELELEQGYPEVTQDDIAHIQRKIEKYKRRNKFDELVIDFHTSPNTGPVYEGHDIPEIIKILKNSGWASDELWVRIDTTIDHLHSKSMISLLNTFKTEYESGKIHFAFLKSAHKLMGLGFDRLTGGFLEIFSKNERILKRFEKYKKLERVENHDVQGFGMLLEFAERELHEFPKLIFENARRAYHFIKPEFIYRESSQFHLSIPSSNTTNDDQPIHVVLCKDPETYYIQLRWEIDLRRHPKYTAKYIIEKIQAECSRRGFNIFMRDGFSFLDTVIASLGPFSLRFSLGGESIDKIQALSHTINVVCHEIRKELAP